MACNVDWLSFNVKSKDKEPTIECPEGYRMEVLTGNNIFKNRFILYDVSGVKLFTVLWCPYSSVVDSRIMTCQIANSQLYINDGILKCYELLKRCVDCCFNACSRIDICLDFVADDSKMRIIRKLSEGAMYVEKKREGSVWWHENTISKEGKEVKVKQCHCLAWGSKSSEIKVKLYWKSREIGLLPQAKSDNSKKITKRKCKKHWKSRRKEGEIPTPSKPYIVEEWKANNMDTKKVWRLEFSMSGAGQLIWDEKVISLEDVNSPYWFCRVFAGLLRTRFIVRKNQGRRSEKHNGDKIVKFIEVPFDKLPVEWMKYKEKEPLTPDGEVLKVIRHLILQCDNEVLRCNSEYIQNMYNLIDTICQKSNAYPYVYQLLGKSLYDYFCDIYTSAGKGKHDVIPSLSKSIS